MRRGPAPRPWQQLPRREQERNETKSSHGEGERMASRMSPFRSAWCHVPRRVRKDSESSEVFADEDDRARGLRHAALRLDGDRELRGLVAEALLAGDVEDCGVSRPRVERAGGDRLPHHAAPELVALFQTPPPQPLPAHDSL